MKRIASRALLLPLLVLVVSGVFAKNDTTALNVSNGSTSAIILRGSLVNFAAAFGKNYFDLNWNTIAAQNCDHFEIERSIDGERFEKVGEVKRNISAEENYAFRDNVKPTVA